MTGKRSHKPSKTRSKSPPPPPPPPPPPQPSEAERRRHRNEMFRIERAARDHLQGLARRMNVWEKESFNKVRDINPNILDPRIAEPFPQQVVHRMGDGFEPPVPQMNRHFPDIIGGRRNIEPDLPPGFMERDVRRDFGTIGRDSWFPRESPRGDVREFWNRRSPQRMRDSDSWGRRSPMLNNERIRRLSRSPIRDPNREQWGPRPLSRENIRGFWGRRSPLRNGAHDSWEERPMRRDFEENSWQPHPPQRDVHPLERFSRRDPRPEMRMRSRSRSGPPRQFINEEANRQLPEGRFAAGGRASPLHGRNFPSAAPMYREDLNFGPPDRSGPLKRHEMAVGRRLLADPLSSQQQSNVAQLISDPVTNVREAVGSLNKYITGGEGGSGDGGLSAGQMTRARELLEELLATVSGKAPTADVGLHDTSSAGGAAVSAAEGSTRGATLLPSSSSVVGSVAKNLAYDAPDSSFWRNEGLRDAGFVSINEERFRPHGGGDIDASRLSRLPVSATSQAAFDDSRGWRGIEKRQERLPSLLDDLEADHFASVKRSQDVSGSNMLSSMVGRMDTTPSKFDRGISSREGRRK